MRSLSSPIASSPVRAALFGLLIAVVGMGAAPPASGQVDVEVRDVSGAVGDTVTVPIEVTGLDERGDVTAYEFVLPFDTTVVDITGVSTSGTVTASPTVNVTADTLKVSASSAEPLGGSELLLNLDARLTGAGSARLAFHSVQFFDQEGTEVSATTDAGIVTDAPLVDVQLPDVQGTAGDEVALELQASNLDGRDVTAYEFAIPFDASVVDLTGVDIDGTVTPSAPTVNVTDGELRVSFSAAEPLSGDGPLLTLRGTLTGAGTGQLDFRSLKLFGQDGREVASGTRAGIVTSDPRLTGRIADASGPVGDTVSVPVRVEGLDGADVTAYEFAVPFDPSVMDLVGVDVEGTVTPSAPTVNVTDGELRVSFSAAEPLSGSGRLLTLQAALTGRGSDVLDAQDVQFFNSDAEAVAGTMTSGIVTVEGTGAGVSVRIPDVEGDPGQAVTIPIRTDTLDGAGVTAYQLTLPFDPSVLDVTGVSASGTTTPSAPTVNVEDDQVRVSFSATDSLSGAGPLLRLQAQLVGVGTDVLDVRNVQFFNVATEVPTTFTPGRAVVRPPSATSAADVQGDGEVDFRNTGLSISFSDVSGAGEVTVSKFRTAPTGTGSIPEQNVSQYRYVVSASQGLAVGSGTEIRFDVSTLAGVTTPSAVTVYRRDSVGRGTFASVPTRVDAETGELVAEVSSFSEFALASDSEPLSASLLAVEGPGPVDPGASATVTVGVPSSFDPLSGTFFYREAGARSFTEVPLGPSTLQTGDDTTFTVTIPSDVVSRRGVQYYVQLRGQTRADTEQLSVVAPAGAPGRSGFIPVQFPSVGAQGPFPPATYRMLSVPVALGDRSIYDVLENQYGAPDPAEWRVARWNPNEEAYAFGEAAAGDVAPGEAVWLITAGGDSLSVGNGVQSADAAGPRSVTLGPGWNQIGSPFPFPVAWADVRRPGSVRLPVAYDASQSEPYQFESTTLRPWRGAFVFNEADSAVTIRIPPLEAEGEASPNASLAKAGAAADAYRLQATAIHSRDGRTLTDRATWVGFDEAAQSGFGPKDRAKPPAVGPHVRLHVMPEEGPALARSLKPPTTEGAAWDLRVGLRLDEPIRSPKEVTVVLNEQGPRPAGFKRYVVDRDRGRRLPVTHGSVTVRLTEDQPTRRLRVIVGTEAFARQNDAGASLTIEKTKLRANAPNPFTESTTIPYQLAEEADVTIAVYDLLGRRVRTLVDRTQRAGVHRVEWRPGQGGDALASGVYFCRMKAGSYRDTRKVILVR